MGHVPEYAPDLSCWTCRQPYIVTGETPEAEALHSTVMWKASAIAHMREWLAAEAADEAEGGVA